MSKIKHSLTGPQIRSLVLSEKNESLSDRAESVFGSYAFDTGFSRLSDDELRRWYQEYLDDLEDEEN